MSFSELMQIAGLVFAVPTALAAICCAVLARAPRRTPANPEERVLDLRAARMVLIVDGAFMVMAWILAAATRGAA